MDAPMLTPDESRELEQLRARAYGPDGGLDGADIHRLQQLETTAHADLPPARAEQTTEPADPGAAVALVPEASAHLTADGAWTEEQVTDGTPGTAGDEKAPPRPRRGRVVAVAVVAVVVLLAGVWGVARGVAPASDLTLSVVATDPATGRGSSQAGFLRSYGIDLDDIQQFEPHRSLTLWASRTDVGQRCLVVEAGEYGTVGLSCTPRGLDPTVDLTVWEGMPEGIAGDLPTGSVVRFVLEGDHVQVWERAADSDL
ncbi:hypothetical protein [Microbacterium sp. P05]|uniref:hypothetical protein n=1 Tax=Microbacterium sp. P05 TaxID=3366948 RepID=UPI0037464488